MNLLRYTVLFYFHVFTFTFSFQRSRRTDKQARSLCTGDNEQADHDQRKSEGSEERTLPRPAEDPRETRGKGAIWSYLDSKSWNLVLSNLAQL